MNGIKMEEDTKVKPEPSSPMALDDVDEYEDTGELVISSTNAGWLTQVPKELWQALSALSDEDQIQVGDLKVWNMEHPGKEKALLEFRADLKGFSMVPKEYDMQIHQRDAKNTFVFTEKNLAGFQAGGRGQSRAERPRAQNERTGSSFRVNKSRRGPRSIPKHTSLFSVPDTEVRATPRDNEEWRRMQAFRDAVAARERDSIPLLRLDEHHTRDMERKARGIGASGVWDTFSTANGPAKRYRPQENKAARIPEDQLLDQLFKLFQEYRFYPIRVLKQKTRQPEAYLREVLSKIGVLLKKGPAANTWTLQEQFRLARNIDWDAMGTNEDEMIAKVEEGAEDDDEGDDDDDMEMEDVKIG